MTRALVAALVLLALTSCAGSAHAPHARRAPSQSMPPAADSVTLALWRFDDSGGTKVADSGPFRLDGVAGLDTRSEFGRFRSGRLFVRDQDSFVFVGYNPALEAPYGFTIEAWLYLNNNAPYELQVIAARWTPTPNQQSWVLGVTGNQYHFPQVPVESPGWFTSLVGLAQPEHLLFGFTPATAGGPRGYVSTATLPLQRWTHVAASVDGQNVRLWIDGRLDAIYGAHDTIRPSQAPLVVGNDFDPRYLTSFGGDLRVDPSANVTMFYQLDGDLDELRLSSTARASFDSVSGR